MVRPTRKQMTGSRNSSRSLNVDTTNEAYSYVHKYSVRLTKSWKPLNRKLKDYFKDLIGCSVKSVSSKPQFSSNNDVQNMLSQLKKRLERSLDDIVVPSKKYSDHMKLKSLHEELIAELGKQKTQELCLQKSIRDVEREVESLERMQDDEEETVQLDTKIPCDVLGLPYLTL